ncbi:hypothetical protein [Actinomadura rudentiformis]|uniref:Uncharacterized protein n=1 Tax=Actinomadura rudentiformis TaxID=359158 RepID=A0A6H9YUG5_9ACTN|nr:hypothetical protein [Actinomadura rudentiformis]KAB2348033.1 hypothetical protein F8566_19400 [Actinomadura rudentiformis]
MQPGTPRRPGDVPPQSEPDSFHYPQGHTTGAYPADVPGTSITTGPIGVRETSGVEVRLGSRSGRNRAQAERRKRAGRRRGLILTAVVTGVAAMIAGGAVFAIGFGEKSGGGDPPTNSRSGSQGAAPRSGKPVAITTAEGAQYQVAAVNGGVSAGGEPTVQSSPLPAGSAVAYIDYVLSNPTDQKVLLDPPGDVFVKRNLVARQARGRCMWQAGVPETMCTPPTQSEVIRRISGGELEAGDGGDKYMPARSSYLIRAMVEVPVDRRLTRNDLRLYIWQKRFVSGQYAQPAPFPN